jgi:hypothetical protein
MSEHLNNNIKSIFITIFPTMAYVFYLFCKKYYKYMLHYNLLILDINYSTTSNEILKQFDIYNNTDNYEPMNKETNNKETQTDEKYYNNILIALNEIPT